MKTVQNYIIDTCQVDIDYLMPFQGEAKELSQKNRYKLRKEILDTGFSFAFHVWKNGAQYFIIDGHQRLSVLRNLRKEGYEVPPMTCNLIKAETIKEAKERVLQAISQYGKLNKQGLEDFVGDDFDNLTMDERFDFPDFTFEFDGKVEAEKEAKDKEDEIPEENGNPREIGFGDIWQLGDHFLMCGDSTDESMMNEFLLNQKADLVFFDPPFTKPKEAKAKELEAQTMSWIKLAEKHMTDGNFIFMSGARVLRDCYPIFQKCKLEYRYDMIWHRTVPLLGPSLEKPIMFHVPIDIYRKGKSFFNRSNEGVKEYLNDIDRIPSVVKCLREKDVGRGGKPMALMCPLLGSFSNKTVLDLCGGNGSTIIASEIVGRKCYSIEIDPVFCNVIIDRWEKHTGHTAEEIVGG